MSIPASAISALLMQANQRQYTQSVRGPSAAAIGSLLANSRSKAAMLVSPVPVANSESLPNVAFFDPMDARSVGTPCQNCSGHDV